MTLFDPTDEKFKEYMEFEEEKRKTIKRGPNVVHIDYYKGILNIDDLKIIENKLQESNLELSSFDKSGSIYANATLDSNSLNVAIIIATPIITKILTDVYPNALWDCIKYIILQVRGKINFNETLFKNKGKKIIKEEIKFGMKMNTSSGATYEFQIDGNLSEDFALKALDKTLNIMKEDKKGRYFCKYNEKDYNWDEIDIEKEIRDKFLKK